MSDERWIITDELRDFVEPLRPKTRTSGGSATQGARGFPTARALRSDPSRGGEISLS